MSYVTPSVGETPIDFRKTEIPEGKLSPMMLNIIRGGLATQIRKSGLNNRQIGQVFGLSKSRIQWLIAWVEGRAS